MPEKTEVIYIAGLSRVGSTLLDRILSCHKNIVGLGEIYEIIRPDWNRIQERRTCTCGLTVEDCPFWGKAQMAMVKQSDTDISHRYQIILDNFLKTYGPGKILLDSSKLAEGIEILEKLQNKRKLKIIYLTRDVRAWTISRIDNFYRYQKDFSKNGFYTQNLIKNHGKLLWPIKWAIPFLANKPIYYFLSWYYQNKKLAKQLNKLNIDYIQIGYDELTLYPEKILNIISEFLQINFDKKMLTMQQPSSHILSGNPLRHDKSRLNQIHYDNRWFKRNEWLIPSLIFPSIMKYNNDIVYSNTHDSIFESVKDLPETTS